MLYFLRMAAPRLFKSLTPFPPPPLAPALPPLPRSERRLPTRLVKTRQRSRAGAAPQHPSVEQSVFNNPFSTSMCFVAFLLSRRGGAWLRRARCHPARVRGSRAVRGDRDSSATAAAPRGHYLCAPAVAGVWIRFALNSYRNCTSRAAALGFSHDASAARSKSFPPPPT